MKNIVVVSVLAVFVIIVITVVTRKSKIDNTVSTQSNDSFVSDFFGVENNMSLRYFSESEFGGWFDKMSPELLKKLDAFRHEWGFAVEVSPHHDAVGREHPTSESQHNILKWGEVRAVDIFPKNSVGGYINSRAERKRALAIAKKVGFSGIGIYVDTSPGNMLHVDVRSDRSASNPALWSRVDGKYESMSKVV